MQNLRWLFKVAHEQSREAKLNPKEAATDQEDKVKDFSVLRNCCGAKGRSRKIGEKSKYGEFVLSPFAIFLCKNSDIADTFFYKTLDLKRLSSFKRQQNHRIYRNSNMKKGVIIGCHTSSKVDNGSTNNKVLPISEGENNVEGCGGEEKIEKKEKQQNKMSISRMKELLRWAAAAKSAERGGKFLGRKVMHFRNKSTTLKSVPDDDQLSNESPKISFRWEAESCSTITSSYSMPSLSSTPFHNIRKCSSRRGNWITTDNEFVVLEL